MFRNILKSSPLALFAIQLFNPVVFAQTGDRAANDVTLPGLVDMVRAEVAQNVSPTVVFDLDDTTFDTRFKSLMILRDFIAQTSVRAKYKSETDKIAASLNDVRIIRATIDETMYGLGITNKSFISIVKEFYAPRMISNWYLSRDVVAPGAVDYINTLYRTGARIAYITNRGPKLRSGTEKALRANNLPFELPGVSLYFNEKNEDVVAYKARIMAGINKTSKIVGGFENEPDNINMFITNYPNGFMFFLDTFTLSHSPLKPGIVVIKNFLINR